MHEMQTVVTDMRGVRLLVSPSVCLSHGWIWQRVRDHLVQPLSNWFGLFLRCGKQCARLTDSQEGTFGLKDNFVCKELEFEKYVHKLPNLYYDDGCFAGHTFYICVLFEIMLYFVVCFCMYLSFNKFTNNRTSLWFKSGISVADRCILLKCTNFVICCTEAILNHLLPLVYNVFWSWLIFFDELLLSLTAGTNSCVSQFSKCLWQFCSCLWWCCSWLPLMVIAVTPVSLCRSRLQLTHHNFKALHLLNTRNCWASIWLSCCFADFV